MIYQAARAHSKSLILMTIMHAHGKTITTIISTGGSVGFFLDFK